jgi:hypothetical protein
MEKVFRRPKVPADLATWRFETGEHHRSGGLSKPTPVLTSARSGYARMAASHGNLMPPLHSVFPPPVRLWIAWNETAFYAGLTIAMRAASLASSFWIRGALPPRTVARLVREKQLAAFESMMAVGAASLRQRSGIEPVKLAAAALKPYRRRTRANVSRLRKRKR